MPLAWEMTAPPPGPSDRSTTAIEYPGLVLGSHHGVAALAGGRPCWCVAGRCHGGKAAESEDPTAMGVMRAIMWRSMVDCAALLVELFETLFITSKGINSDPGSENVNYIQNQGVGQLNNRSGVN